MASAKGGKKSGPSSVGAQPGRNVRAGAVGHSEHPMCSQPAPKPIVLPPDLAPGRAYAIRIASKKWANGTVLHYCFIDQAVEPRWSWEEEQKEVVREAFAIWKAVGIGLSFVEVDDPSEAEIKIGCLLDDGSWSWVGTDILHNNDLGRTMNFGWDLTTPWGHATALHEIGHTIGFEHEHQNPNAGIVWDDEAVYRHYAKPPNNWKREVTYQNILRKLDAPNLEGTRWDVVSNLQYPIAPGLMISPEPYDRTGVPENQVLSDTDKRTVLRWYPAVGAFRRLNVLEVQRLVPELGSETSFAFTPSATRKYRIQTLGESDCKIVLFEERQNEPRYMLAQDDSGMNENIFINQKLVAGRNYIINVRIHFADRTESDGVGLVIS